MEKPRPRELAIIAEGATADFTVWRGRPRRPPALGLFWTAAALTVGAMLLQLWAGSPGGIGAYTFGCVLLGALLLEAAVFGVRSRLQLTLRTLIWLWLIWEYLIDANVVTVLGIGHPSLGGLPPEAYSRTYWAGAAAVLGTCLGMFAGKMVAGRVPELKEDPGVFRRVSVVCLLIFACFAVAGIASLAFLLSDDTVRERFLYRAGSFLAPVGMGRYINLVFMLPTTAIVAWLLLIRKVGVKHSWASRVMVILVALGISLLHLIQGRRLVWASTVMMALYIAERDGLLRLRWWWLALATCGVLPLFIFLRANKNTGFIDLFTARARTPSLLEIASVLGAIHQDAGRFDLTAALIADRDERGFYWGATFAVAPLHLLPTGLGFRRPLGLREDLGRVLYGDWGLGSVSEEVSMVAELYCNFGYLGITAGFFLIGLVCRWIDARWAETRDPIRLVAYGLCLFRLPHHLITAASSWFPLTALAFLPVAVCAVTVRLFLPNGEADRHIRLALNLGFRHSGRCR